MNTNFLSNNPTVKAGIIFLSIFMFIGLFINIDLIRRDTMYIRQTLQFNEEPIEPFCAIEIVPDSIFIICDPNDTTRVKELLIECKGDSIQLNVEYVD